MPDPHRLAVVTELRRAAGVTLEQMAAACGLVGRKGRESASAWERGHSVPHARKRTQFIEYLGHTLGLRRDPSQFQSAWNILVEEWRWEPVSEAEWHQHFVDIPLAVAADSALPSMQSVIQTDVQGLIERMPTTNSALPPPAPLPAGSRMPFSRNPLFTGRAADLLALAMALKAGGTAAISQATIAAAGLSGIGKTQLAVEFAHRYGQFFAGGVFWLSFADANAVPSEIAACGGAGHLALRPDFAQLTLERQVRLVRDAWENPLPRLLIFDNCEDQELLARWRPSSGGCRVLVTSRRAQWDAALGVGTLLLSVLSRRESVTLLRKHCPDLSVNDINLTAIAAELDDLPLALHLAGHYLAIYRPEVPPATYVRQLRSPNVLDHPSLQSGRISPTGHDQHVARTFALSYARLETREPIDTLARDVLAHAAYLAPGEPIPRELLSHIITNTASGDRRIMPGAVDLAIRRLVDSGLIEVVGDRSGALLRMHRLVVAFTRQLSTNMATQAEVERALLTLMQRLNQIGKQQQLLTIQAHLRAVTDTAQLRDDPTAAALCYELSWHLHQVATHAEAMRYNSALLPQSGASHA